MRRVLAAILVLVGVGLVATPGLAQECSHGVKGPCAQCKNKPTVVREAEGVAADLVKLEEKMNLLAKKLRQQGQEHYAQKLEQGLKKLKTDAVSYKVRELVDMLEKGQFDNVLTAGGDVSVALKALLDLLEDRTSLEEIKKKEAELKAALERLKEIKKAEEQIKKETENLNKEREKEFDQVRQDLERLIDLQRDLKRETESGPPRDLMKEIEDAIAKIEKMQAEQKEVERQFEAAKSKELRDVGELARKLADLIDRQERAKKSVEATEERRKSLAKALQELDGIIDDQKKTLAHTQDAARAPDKANQKALDREQGDLNDRTWNLGNELFQSKGLSDDEKRKILEPLADADGAQKAAKTGIEEAAYDLAKGDQDRAIKDLEKAREELRKVKEAADQARAGEAGRQQQDQDQIQKDAKSLADSLKESGKASDSPAMAKAMENAGQKTDQASQNGQQARDNIQKGQGEQAARDQQQALDRMKEARQELDKLMAALGQKDQPKFQEPAQKQEDLAAQARELADRLNQGARSPMAQQQSAEAQKQLLDAAGEMRNAQGAMQQSSGEMQKAQTGQAQQSQSQAQQNLEQAKQALQKARQDMASRKEPDFKNLAEAQKKLEEALKERVTKWLEQKAKEEKDEKKAQGLNEAAQSSQQAQQQMQQAQQQMQQGQPQASQAGKPQGEAQKKMEEAKKKLDELAKRPLNEKEKKKAEELAKKQAETKDATKELEKLLEQMQKENAQRSAQSAQGNMQQAQKNLQQGDPNQAEQDEENALEDLKQAEKELEDALEELRRQAQEEMLIQLETELRKVIETQELINKSTKDLDEARQKRGALDRREAIKARTLGTTEETVVRLLEEIKKKLGEEDVLVFRYVIESVIDDLTESAEALKEAEVGARTQEVQADAVRKLKELLDAFKIKRKQSKGGGGGRQGGGGKKPLVPDLVQLNMMKKLQEELLRKTQKVQRDYKANRDDLTPVEKVILKRLSDEQGKLAELMEKFIQKFEQQKQKQEKEE